VAKELNVAHVLEGSVRKSGNRLRITAQLIDARSDKHLWSETYDRSLDDIFAVQDEIAAAVVAQLKVTLLGVAPKAEAFDPKAYALHLQARQLARLGTPESFAQSIMLCQQALAIDPRLAASWVLMASVYSGQADLGYRSNEEGYRLAREALDKALAINPDLGTAHAGLARVITALDQKPAPAAQHLERALALEPANTEIMTEAMRFARTIGRYELVIALGEYVVAHDPVNTLAHATLGGAYIRAGRYDEGIESLRTSLRLAPSRGLAHYTIALAFLRKGDPAGALAEMQLEPSETWRLDGLALVYHAAGRRAESDAALGEIVRKHEHEMAWNIASVHAFRREADRTFEWLEKAIAYNDPGLTLSAMAWQFDGMREDPRWLPFLRRIGYAPEQLAAIKFDVKLPSR
jgi:tetratricopeptide (TPR) repeat protein